MNVGDLRRVIQGMADDLPVYIEYNVVKNDQTFVRVDGITKQSDKAIRNPDDPPGPVLMLSLLCPDDPASDYYREVPRNRQ